MGGGERSVHIVVIMIVVVVVVVEVAIKIPTRVSSFGVHCNRLHFRCHRYHRVSEGTHDCLRSVLSMETF